ncbi:uncharacterized protein LOC110429231 [Herrania umbratica]|uniref:Uncharacterized protein LOC110429231 n=1 Tax=Herrania umbratica TaxID=108875 RepID=A0A6J1BP44_9ROSI|nr:uncharacterized protein LOC110429231 [Herrania umbratica]
MASTISPPVLQSLSVRCAHNAHPGRYVKPQFSKPALTVSLPNRRQLLFFLTATTALTVRDPASNAEDIPLFGLRKKLKSAEEEAVQIVKEGFETAEKGLETAEKGIITVEKGLKTAEKKIETAEKEIESAVSFGALAQAGAVAGAEFLGVVVATSIVNGILGPEAQKS